MEGLLVSWGQGEELDFTGVAEASLYCCLTGLFIKNRQTKKLCLPKISDASV